MYRLELNLYFRSNFTEKLPYPMGGTASEKIVDYAAGVFRNLYGKNTPLPETFVTVDDLSPEEHVNMQAAAQKWVDSGISKTINYPEDISFRDFENLYVHAYSAGCKGCKRLQRLHNFSAQRDNRNNFIKCIAHES